MKLTQQFAYRHIGPDAEERRAMLNLIGVGSLEELISETVPRDIRLKASVNIAPAITEYQHLSQLKKPAAKNKLFGNYISLGYYDAMSTHA